VYYKPYCEEDFAAELGPIILALKSVGSFSADFG